MRYNSTNLNECRIYCRAVVLDCFSWVYLTNWQLGVRSRAYGFNVKNVFWLSMPLLPTVMKKKSQMRSHRCPSHTCEQADVQWQFLHSQAHVSHSCRPLYLHNTPKRVWVSFNISLFDRHNLNYLTPRAPVLDSTSAPGDIKSFPVYQNVENKVNWALHCI